MPPRPGCPSRGPPSPEVTGVICLVPSTPFSQTPWYALPVHLCRFGVRSVRWRCFLEALGCRSNPIRIDNGHAPSHPAGGGILTPFPSTTPFGLALGAGSPCADYLYAGTLGLSAREFLTLFVATHVSILTSDTSSSPHGPPSQAYGTLRYRAFRHPQLRYVA